MAIAAGVVFIVAVIFFSGFFLGRVTHGPYDGKHVSGGGESTCRMGSGGGMGPGMMGPGASREPRQTTMPGPQPTPHP
ncbi:hypothetical protein ACX9NE_03785 [Mycobacterium sp. ML4]